MSAAPDIDLYVLVATVAYMLPMVALAGWSAAQMLLQYTAVWRALAPDDYRLLAGVALVQALLVLAAAVSIALDDSTRLLALGVVANVIPVGAALVIYPLAMVRHREHAATRPGPVVSRVFPVASWWVAGGIAWVVIMAWSLLWMAAIHASGVEIEVAKQFADIGSSPLNWVLLAPLALLAAFVEEMIFRLGLQGLIGRLLHQWDPRGIVAIVASTLVWTLGHAANATPHGLKEIHIVVVGLVLGRVMQTHGLRAAIAAHLGLNASAVAMAALGAVLGIEE